MDIQNRMIMWFIDKEIMYEERKSVRLRVEKCSFFFFSCTFISKRWLNIESYDVAVTVVLLYMFLFFGVWRNLKSESFSDEMDSAQKPQKFKIKK